MSTEAKKPNFRQTHRALCAAMAKDEEHGEDSHWSRVMVVSGGVLVEEASTLSAKDFVWLLERAFLLEELEKLLPRALVDAGKTNAMLRSER